MPALGRALANTIGFSDSSEWFLIDGDHLQEFGHSTYLDPALVDLTPSRNNVLGPELIDGFMLVSLLLHFDFARPLVAVPGVYGFNYGLDRVRFTSPVMLGQRIRHHRTVTGVEEKSPTRFLVSTTNVFELEGSEKPAMYAEWKTMIIDGAAEAVGPGSDSVDPA